MLTLLSLLPYLSSFLIVFKVQRINRKKENKQLSFSMLSNTFHVTYSSLIYTHVTNMIRIFSNAKLKQ